MYECHRGSQGRIAWLVHPQGQQDMNTEPRCGHTRKLPIRGTPSVFWGVSASPGRPRYLSGLRNISRRKMPRFGLVGELASQPARGVGRG